MLQVTIPQSLQLQFPDLVNEDPTLYFAVQNSAVRYVGVGLVGDTDTETDGEVVFNGIALDEIIANFANPAAPDLTDLVGTWVRDYQSFNGDTPVIHFFANGYYESSGTCDNDGSTGMEYGTFSWDGATGAVTVTSQVSTEGACSPALGAANGNTMFVNGDSLTVSTNGFGDITYHRLTGTFDPLVGSWITGNIQDAGEAHTIVTFLDDGTMMLSQNCVGEQAGFEYGSYNWDEGITNGLSGNLSLDTNGSCGLVGDGSFAFAGFIVTISGDTLTLTVPGEGDVIFTRHSVAFVPVVAAIPFDGAALAGTSQFNVFYEGNVEQWVIEEMAFGGDGSSYTHTHSDANGDPAGTVDTGAYEVVSGVLYIFDGMQFGDYIMIMSVDAITGANRTCWVGDFDYADLANCIPPGEEFMFDNLIDAENFRDSVNAQAVFSGSAVDASVVLATGGTTGFDIYGSEIEYFTLESDGVNVVEDDYSFDFALGDFVLGVGGTDIALTSNGWLTVDYSLDTVVEFGAVARLQNLEGADVLTDVTVSFLEMDISGQSLFDYVDIALPQFMDNGVYSAGAKAYELTFTENVTYYFIGLWDDFCGGAYNGNCNVVRSQQLNRSTGDLFSNSEETDTGFLGVNTTALEVGYAGSQTLLAVFNADNTIEFWEVNWNVSSTATVSAFSGTWNALNLNTETLIEYTIPVELQFSYSFQFDVGESEGFVSVQNGYLRHGQTEFLVGDTGTEIHLNSTATQDVINSIK